eukprot:1228292-Prymnesium_polylepis.1
MVVLATGPSRSRPLLSKVSERPEAPRAPGQSGDAGESLLLTTAVLTAFRERGRAQRRRRRRRESTL